MIDFSFTEGQERFREKVREFARKELAPRRKEWDREKKSCWRIVNKRFAEWGLVDPNISHVTRGILVEEIAYIDFNSALAITYTTLPFAYHKLPGVPEEIRRPIQEGIMKGERFLAFCYGEPAAGTDMAAFEATATKDGNEWVINGYKNTISWVDATDYVVTARTAGREAGVWALTDFYVPGDTPGVGLPEVWADMGNRGVHRGCIRFDNVRVPLNYVVGELGKGYLLAVDLFDTNRAWIGLKCIGAAQASVDESGEYARQRVSMGNPISKYQAISFALAEAQTLLEAGRWLCYKTLWKADRGERHDVEGAMCKWWVPEVCLEIVRKCLLIHGQYGYTEDLPFEQRMRDILGWQIGDGTPEPSKLMIARSMIGKSYVG